MCEFGACSKYNGYIAILGPTIIQFAHVESGNKGQWVLLETGQMAGFFPVSSLLDPQRLAPGCPAAWLSGSLLDDWVTPIPQRWMCICALSSQSGKGHGCFQWICI